MKRLGEVRFGVAIVALWLAACGGCGTSGPDTVAVQGRVTYDSQPVTEGNVVFENAAHGWLRAAPLDSNGEFRIDDLIIADYVVTVRPPEPKLPNETMGIEGPIVITPAMMPNPTNIPRRFRSADTTPLKASVAADATRFDFDLAHPPAG